MEISAFYLLTKHFLTSYNSVYLDNNATTSIAPSVLKKMKTVLKNNFGNPSSLYKEAYNSAIILNESRLTIAQSINANFNEIYFTGSASESNNTIIKSISEQNYPLKKKILSTPIEHASVINTLEYLKEKGIEIQYIPVDNKGKILLEEYANMLDTSTMLVCCMFANNEIGVIQDLKKITELAHKKSIPVFADCVQALGKIKVDVKELDVDFATFSAHKIHGPKGCGALYIKSENNISPLIHGGHQENGMRAGTESLHNIAGFAEACKLISKSITKSSKILQLKTYFIDNLKLLKPDILLSSPDDIDCLPNTINIVFSNINNAYLIATLQHFNIAVSAGSACNTQANEPSHVLTAIGLSEQQARESIRFSLGVHTTKRQINYTLKIIKNFLENKYPQIGMLEPKLLDEKLIFDNNTFIMDVRFWHDRKFIKGIPNSYEFPFFAYKKYLKKIPENKNIITVCQGGYIAPIVAYELKCRGFKNVSFLILGMLGWKQTNPELYEKYSGQNIKKL